MIKNKTGNCLERGGLKTRHGGDQSKRGGEGEQPPLSVSGTGRGEGGGLIKVP